MSETESGGGFVERRPKESWYGPSNVVMGRCPNCGPVPYWKLLSAGGCLDCRPHSPGPTSPVSGAIASPPVHGDGDSRMSETEVGGEESSDVNCATRTGASMTQRGHARLGARAVCKDCRKTRVIRVLTARGEGLCGGCAGKRAGSSQR